MTQIRYIGALVPQTKRELQAAESKDIPREVMSKRVIEYSGMTNGELSLMLALEELQLMGAYYGDVNGDYRNGIVLLQDAIYNGLHTSNKVGKYTGSQSKGVSEVAELINRAKLNAYPAGTMLNYDARAKIENDAPIQTSVRGFDPYQPFSIEQVNCAAKYRIRDDNGRIISGNLSAYNECVRQNDAIRAVNNFIEESGGHFIYSFLPDNDVFLQNGVVASKYVNHRTAIANIADVTGLSIENLNQWFSNGVRRANVLKGTEPYSPLQSSRALNQASIDGIGEPITIAAVLSIISAILAAAGAVVGMIQSFQPTIAEQLRDDNPFMGLEEFGGLKSDFANKNFPDLLDDDDPDNPNNGGGIATFFEKNKKVIGGAAAAVGIFALVQSQNKKSKSRVNGKKKKKGNKKSNRKKSKK